MIRIASTRRRWFATAGVVTLLVMAAVGAINLSSSDHHAPYGVMTSTPTATDNTATEDSSMAAAMLAQQQSAMASLSQHPYMKPIIGSIEERPEYVSLIEWAMLKAVANNHDDPAHELTRLVNFLRFTKQLEIWQAMTASADRSHRAELAAGLLAELAQHVTDGNLDAAEADRISRYLKAGSS